MTSETSLCSSFASSPTVIATAHDDFLRRIVDLLAASSCRRFSCLAVAAAFVYVARFMIVEPLTARFRLLRRLAFRWRHRSLPPALLRLRRGTGICDHDRSSSAARPAALASGASCASLLSALLRAALCGFRGRSLRWLSMLPLRPSVAALRASLRLLGRIGLPVAAHACPSGRLRSASGCSFPVPSSPLLRCRRFSLLAAASFAALVFCSWLDGFLCAVSAAARLASALALMSRKNCSTFSIISGLHHAHMVIDRHIHPL